MAAMIARDSMSQLHSLATQAKGPRNKRKFRADSPLGNTNLVIQPHVDLPSYGLPVGFSSNQHVNVGESFDSSCRPRDVLDADDYEDADWSDATEAQLRELLINNLHAIFKSSIKKIASYGYSEEEATKAVLRSSLCFGCKDIISNIVDKALGFLKSGHVIDTSAEFYFENLQQLEEHILAEMICILREVRPFFSVGDAMWCLIICDMNVSQACAMEIEGLTGFGSDESSFSSPVSHVKPELGSGSSCQKILEFGAPKPNKSDPLPPFSSGSPQPEMPFVAGIPNLPPVRLPLTINHNSVIAHPNSGKEDPLPLADSGVREFCSTALSESHIPGDRAPSGKRCNAGGNSKRDSFLQQKSIPFEKNYRAYRSQGVLKTGKFGSLGSSMDKKHRPSSDSSGSSYTNSMLKAKSLGTDVNEADENSVISFSAGAPACSPMSGSSQFPIANTELSLALPSNNINKGSGSYTQTSNNYSGSSFDNLNRHWIAQDRKEELLNKLVSHVHDLQTQLQDWSQWAQQKVMQAARRLSKDKAELQALRHEKEEVCRLQKEKQTLEENTTKKLSEMESALSKASCQVEKANNAILRLEVDNSHLRHEMESAKAQAAESAVGFQEVSRRELKVLKNFQSWDKQKALFQDELMNEKQEHSKLQQQLDDNKAFLDKLEAKLKEEEKSKSEILNQLNSERKEKEKIEASAKSKADMMKLKAENEMQRHKGDMRKLENQVVQLRLKMDTAIAALSGPTNGSCASCLADVMNSALKENSRHTVAHMIALEESGNEVKREWECVMCLTEEMSVIFLPCAHQVVCSTCNELHERQGMKDCPSCRTPIQRRITVRCSGS